MCVAARLLMDHGGIGVRELPPLLGLEPVKCDQLQRIGRGWIEAHEAAVARKRSEAR